MLFSFLSLYGTYTCYFVLIVMYLFDMKVVLYLLLQLNQYLAVNNIVVFEKQSFKYTNGSAHTLVH